MAEYKKLSCNVALANIRIEASHKSELITQCMMHDKLIDLNIHEGVWGYVQLDANKTEGWILKGQCDEISEAAFALKPKSVFTNATGNVENILLGTYSFIEDNLFTSFDKLPRNEETILQLMKPYLNAPYSWGGITTQGIDCSGLSMILYRYFGIALTSFAEEQFNEGSTLDFLQDAQCGDLAFFENDEHKITHVGIMLNGSEILHASEMNGKVKIDYIDNEGIINKHTNQRTHRLRLIKRLQ